MMTTTSLFQKKWTKKKALNQKYVNQTTEVKLGTYAGTYFDYEQLKP